MFHSEQNQKDYFQKNGRNDNIFAVIRITWPKIAQETNKPFDLNNLLNYVSSNYRSFHMNVWYEMLMGPTTSFDLDDFSNCRSSNFMSSTSKLPLRSSHSGMFSKSNYPKKDSSKCNFQYHTSELLVKFFEKCLRWSVIFYKFICTTILRLTAGVDEL